MPRRFRVRNQILASTLALSFSFASSSFAQESALPALRQAAKAAPADAAAQAALGRAMIEAGRLKDAEAQLRLASKLAKGSIESLYDLARVQFATGDYKASRKACRELTEKDANHVLSHVCDARALLVWRRASRAFEHIDKAMALQPGNAEAQLALADARRMQGDFTGAIDAYQKLIASAPSADAYLGLSLVHAVQNRNADAVAALEKAVALDGDDPDVLYELGRRITGKRAIELLKAALAGRPGWPEAELELAIAQLHAGDAATAEAALRAVRVKLPGNPVAVAQHASALVALGRYQEAEPELQSALKAIPNDYDAALALARLYENTNRHEEAFTQYRSAGDLKRESPEALLLAARLGVRLQRATLASALLEKALERAPKNAEVLALYGEVLLSRGDKKGAKEQLQRALAGEGPIDRAAVQKKLAEIK
jgi:tetratricopeptide (TPR) repeat protein